MSGGGKPMSGGGEPMNGGGKPTSGGGEPMNGGGKPMNGGGEPTSEDQDKNGDASHDQRISRAQAALPALVVAIVLLSSATVIAVSVADEARITAERASDARGTAVTLAETLVSPAGPTTRRRNVLDRSRTLSLSAETVDAAVPSVRDRPVWIRIDGDAIEPRTILDRGRVADRRPKQRTGHATRIALLARSEHRTDRHQIDNSATKPVPAHARSVTVQIVSGNVTTIRLADRVLRHRPRGLRGSASIGLPHRRSASLQFEGNGVVETRVELEKQTPIVVRVTVG